MFNWHKTYYHSAFNKTYTSIHKKLNEHGIQLADFWPWVEANHTEAYRKYTSACDKISSLCKDNSPQGMEEFKKATKTEMDAVEWFIDKYIASHTSASSDMSHTLQEEAAA